MMVNEINNVIEIIYNKDLGNIDTEIVNLLSDVMTRGLVPEEKLVVLLQIIYKGIESKNYVYVADVLEFELKPLLMN